MRVETIKKDYFNGLLLRAEAIQMLETVGKLTRKQAESVLDGYESRRSHVDAGAAKSNLLVIRDW